MIHESQHTTSATGPNDELCRKRGPQEKKHANTNGMTTRKPLVFFRPRSENENVAAAPKTTSKTEAEAHEEPAIVSGTRVVTNTRHPLHRPNATLLRANPAKNLQRPESTELLISESLYAPRRNGATPRSRNAKAVPNVRSPSGKNCPQA